MKANKTKIIVVAAIAIAGTAVWLNWPASAKPSGPRTIETLRKQVAADAKDYAGRVELSQMILNAALDQARGIARDEDRFVEHPEAPDFEAAGKALQKRREDVKASIEEAIALAGEAKKIDPAKMDAYLAEAKIYKMRGRWKQLRRLVDEVRAKLPAAKENRELIEDSMLAYVGLMQLGQAEDEAHLLNTPENPHLLAKLVLARVGMLRRDIARADKTLEEAAPEIAASRDPFALEFFGILLRDRNRTQEGVLHLDTAVKILPEMGDFRFVLAAAFRILGDEYNVTHQYKLLFRLDPTDPYVYVGRAESFFHLQKEYDAYVYLGQAMRLAPEDPQILYRLASFIYESTNPKVHAEMVSAREYIERAVEASKGENAEILVLQAKIFARHGQFKEAIESCDKAWAVAFKLGSAALQDEIFAQKKEYVRLQESRPQEPEEIGPMPPAGSRPAATAPTQPEGLDPNLRIELPPPTPSSMPGKQP